MGGAVGKVNNNKIYKEKTFIINMEKVENETQIKCCRSCGNENLKEIISLGDQHVTNFVENSSEQKDKHPLDLVLCDPTEDGGCGLLQLNHNTPPELMWDEQYWYKSAISSKIRDDLKDIVKNAQELITLEKNDIVIDIGSNDGTLLENYSDDIQIVGFEPSKNVAKEAMDKEIPTICNFFNAEDFYMAYTDKKAKIITAISMFYDLEDPNSFLKDIVSILDKDGLFIIQQNYLISMLQKNAFDNICHEHREYYSLYSLKQILAKYNLEIFDVSESDINGGSIRTYIKFKDNDKLGHEESYKRVKIIENMEIEIGIDDLDIYYNFVERIEKIKEDLLKFLNKEKEAGKEIYIYGASTRGNVILQYFGLTPELITAAVDKNPDKHGKKTVGSLIPIVSPEEFREKNPDHLLVMTWHFYEEIKKQEEKWFNNGGEFIIPLPTLKREVKISV